MGLQGREVAEPHTLGSEQLISHHVRQVGLFEMQMEMLQLAGSLENSQAR